MIGRVGLLLAVLGAALLVAPSVGFSTIAVERSIAIEVAPEGEGMVGIDPAETVAPEHENESVTFLTVTNRLDRSVTATAELGPPANETVELEIGAGEEGTVNATVDCADGTTETVAIDLEIAGDGVEIYRTAEVTVECPDADGD